MSQANKQGSKQKTLEDETIVFSLLRTTILDSQPDAPFPFLHIIRFIIIIRGTKQTMKQTCKGIDNIILAVQNSSRAHVLSMGF